MSPAELADHPVRTALLRLLHRDGVVTATTAARELGGSTGLYSFHLRRLAESGLITEAAPTTSGRVRPWRLAPQPPPAADVPPAGASASGAPSARPAASAPAPGPSPRTAAVAREPLAGEDLGLVARGLEDESHQRWMERRATVPERWRRDDAFSQVLYLTPEEMAGLTAILRAAVAQYGHRDSDPGARPPGAAPVAVVSRVFPLLDP